MGFIALVGGEQIKTDFDAVHIADRITAYSNGTQVATVQGIERNAGASSSLPSRAWMPISVDGRDRFVQISQIAYIGD